jgi:SpoVK/Ycf46/Vps4 family AAA+-type ATPase
VEFLLSYRKLLQANIARTTLAYSRFSVRKPLSLKKWEDIVRDYEPVTVFGDSYQFYSRLGTEFLQGWFDNTPKYFSMLLFGPPGTGKTTVAENIADALQFPMITITVSDFLASGGAQLEARAKAIFDVLSSQTNCVVLFDEIDNFLLDPDAARYGEQDTSFQFMTPGMLTKLNDLRRKKRLIFIIATNYENRIDAAIKRTGRIDKRYLVLPPDAKARRRMIERFLRKEKLDPRAISDWTQIAKTSLGFTDIQGAVKDAAQEGNAWQPALPQRLGIALGAPNCPRTTANLGIAWIWQSLLKSLSLCWDGSWKSASMS